MSNPFYEHSGYPQNSEDAQAIDVRAELLAIQAGFDKLCALSGQGDKLVIVRSAETGLTTADGKFLLGATWLPVLSCAVPGNLAITYASQIGVVHRVGKRIDVQFYIATSSFTHTTASGVIRIATVPIISVDLAGFPGSLSYQGITKANYHQFTPVIGTSSTTITISASGSGQTQAGLNITDMPTGGSVILSGSLSFHGQS